MHKKYKLLCVWWWGACHHWEAPPSLSLSSFEKLCQDNVDVQNVDVSFQNTFKAFEVGLLWVYYMGKDNSDINGWNE